MSSLWAEWSGILAEMKPQMAVGQNMFEYIPHSHSSIYTYFDIRLR